MFELIETETLQKFIALDDNFSILEINLERIAHEYLALKKQKKKYRTGERLNLDRLLEITPAVTSTTRRLLGFSESADVKYELFSINDFLKNLNYDVFSDTAGIIVGISTSELLHHYFTKSMGQEPVKHALYLGGLVIAVSIAYRVVPKMFQLFKNGLPSLYSSTIDYDERIITVVANDTVSVVSDISHEYTHFIQYLSGIRTGGTPISEGHARGVELEVCRIFADRYNNPFYKLSALEDTAEDLYDAYLYLCSRNHKVPKESLIGLPIDRKQKLVPRLLKLKPEADYYSIGAAAMSIAESKHGKKVYRQALTHDYSFLEGVEIKK